MAYDDSELYRAIDDSVRMDRTVHLEYSQERAGGLLALCDDWEDSPSGPTYWGTRDARGGGEWWQISLDREED